MELVVAGTPVRALPEGGLWIESQRALIVSDLHLEKGSAFARRGQMLPPYDTRDALNRIAALVERLRPQRIVSLGDSFHDPFGPARLDHQDRARLLSLIAAVDWFWVEGNHDRAAPGDLGGAVVTEMTIAGLVLRHEPTGAEAEIAGHLHPCARIVGSTGSVRRRCFATDGRRLVMPAFGAYAGGLNVRDAAFAPIFPHGCVALVLGRSRLHSVAPTHCARD